MVQFFMPHSVVLYDIHGSYGHSIKCVLNELNVHIWVYLCALCRGTRQHVVFY